MKKEELLNEFRKKADVFLEEIFFSTKDKKKQADLINKKVSTLRKSYIDATQISEKSSEVKLDDILLITYVSYIVMLEYRNKVWKYEYMSFSRRIGEMWEPFCKLPFYYPVKELELFDPPTFKSVQLALKNEINDYVKMLDIENKHKEKLNDYFEKQSVLISSGSINLNLDLHFLQRDTYYNVDYKSGFSSNEKGNTNRLLMVASIYKGLSIKNKTLLFVRQPEAENNHYLQTLKNSKLWEVYSSQEAYQKIRDFTGFDINEWMNKNMKWTEDISGEFKNYLAEEDLLKYLTWY